MDKIRAINYSDSEEEEMPSPKKAKEVDPKKKSNDNNKNMESSKKESHRETSKDRKRRSSNRDDRDYDKKRREDDRKDYRRDKSDHSRDRKEHRSKDHKHRRHDREYKDSKNDKNVPDRHQKYEKATKDRKHKERERRHRSSSCSPDARDKYQKTVKVSTKPSESVIIAPKITTAVSFSCSSSPQLQNIVIQLPEKPIIPLAIAPKIELPSYYNPNVINVNKYADQMEKRKRIWSSKKEEPVKTEVVNKWGNAFNTDDKVASKFMRLMGIKEAPKPEPKPTTSKPSDSGSLFSNMEQQYEVARNLTHISRGVGLGFGSQARPH